MKSKVQKQEEIKKAGELFDKSKILLFIDFAKVTAEDLRRLRRELKSVGAKMFVLKKRLLNVLFKEKGINYDVRNLAGSVGAIFSENGIEEASASVYKFFSTLHVGKEAKAEAVKKILGGFDVKEKSPIASGTIVMIGQLPPREVLLAQLLGVLVSPIRSLLYIMQEKSKQT